MRYTIIVLALLGVLASPRPAAAATGNELLKSCDSSDIGNIACLYYIIGWRDAFFVATLHRYGVQPNHGRNPKMGICIPNEVTNGQLQRVVVKYLRAHPEKLHGRSMFTTGRAMMEAFPCR